MKIGIIGSGSVGGTLGGRWAKNGHQVFFAVRGEPGAQVREVLPLVKTGTAAEAAAAGDVILLATPWEATEEAIRSAGDLAGKIVIDATNPLLPDLSGLTTPQGSSGAELVAGWARGAKAVKAVNTVGFNIMANPKFAAGPVAMFYCGDDVEAKKTVAPLLAELGFEALDAGPLAQARLLEPFALLWITLAYKAGFGREIGFQFMRR